MNAMCKDDILLVSDLTRGGAASSCRRLFRALRGIGVQAQWLAMRGSEDGDASVAASWPDLPALIVRRLMATVRSDPAAMVRWESLYYERCALKAVRQRHPALINLHNLHEAASFAFVERLPREIPLVWTLHDMWPITGYCCYSLNCGKYLTGCAGDCPQMGRWGVALKRPCEEWRRRDLFFRKNQARTILVAPSRWLAECARRRFTGLIRTACIPYGVDVGVFKPMADRRAARQALALSEDVRIALTGTASLDEKRKGLRFLVQAARMLSPGRTAPLTVIALGTVWGQSRLPTDWILPGMIRDETLLNLYYNAADVVVLPSVGDNLPNMLLEATAAGTPCVTFDVGGCSEIVLHGRTGFVAKLGDADDLATCIEQVLTLPREAVEAMRVLCRETAVSTYRPEIQANAYASLFQQMLA